MKRRLHLPTEYRRMPKPRNDAELAILTEWFFWAPLSLSVLQVATGYARYEVKQKFDSYHGAEFRLKSRCQYDADAGFWRFVIGELTCGGVAGSSYGQAKVVGWRNQKRLESWVQSRRNGGVSCVRPAFARLARAIGAGENRTIRGGSVLIAGREDGAAGASIVGDA